MDELSPQLVEISHLWHDLYTCRTLIARLNSEKFQNFHFKPKLLLLRVNHKNDNQGKFLDFYEFTLYMNFAIFQKLAIPIMTIFMKILKIIHRLKSLKSGNSPWLSFLWCILKNDNIDLKMTVLKFLLEFSLYIVFLMTRFHTILYFSDHINPMKSRQELLKLSCNVCIL